MLPVALLAVSAIHHSALPAPQSEVLLAQAITSGNGSTVVTPTGNQIDITGGQVSGDGANLFHSFQEFGLSERQTANFVASPQIQNVLGRIQGGNASYIDGVLKVSNSNANLYLLNPAGFLFGQNARLNLNGSFMAATADRVGFDGGWLDIFETNDYAQLTGEPTRFSFGAAQPGSVVNLGDLAVDENQSLMLLGGNVVNEGSVSAPEGQVTLTAVNGQQTVSLGSADGLLTMELSPLSTARGLSVLSLPELLTGGSPLAEGTELTVNADGTVSLTGAVLPTGVGTAAIAGAVNAGKNVALVAENTVEIVDGDNYSSIIRAGNNLQVQGNQSVNIQSLDQPQSALRAGGDITLISDGTVTGQGRFLNGGDFSVLTLSNEPGTFEYMPSSSDGIISSSGNVSFGRYNGNSLKVEAGGDITVNGDINITAPNTSLRGTDPDIAILSSDPALILRAGLSTFNPQNSLPETDERRNNANISSERIVNSTSSNTIFKVSDNASSTGNITVGNVETNKGPVILSATGDIRTGDIVTKGDNTSEQDTFGGYVNLLAEGSVEVSTINTRGTDGGDVTINAGGTFRATGTFLEDDFTDSESTLNNVQGAQVLGTAHLVSIYTAGVSEGGATIDISHGGRTFVVGPVFEVDENGKIIYREFSITDGEILLKEQVFPVKDEGSDDVLVDENGNVVFGYFKDAEGNKVFEDEVLAASNPFDSNDPGVSYTAGAITSNQENEGLVISIRESPIVGTAPFIVGDGRIQVTSTFTDSGVGTGVGMGGNTGINTGSGGINIGTGGSINNGNGTDGITSGVANTSIEITTAAIDAQTTNFSDSCGLSNAGDDNTSDATAVANRSLELNCQQSADTSDLLKIQLDDSNALTAPEEPRGDDPN